MDAFEAAARANDARRAREACDQLQRKRAAQRDHQPMPAGSLFDEVTRAQSDLFAEGKV